MKLEFTDSALDNIRNNLDGVFSAERRVAEFILKNPEQVVTLNVADIAEQSGVGVRLDALAIPVDPAVSGVCGMLGLEPLYLACEGRLVIFAPKERAEAITETLRRGRYSANAAIIGEVTAENAGRVVVKTEIGAETLLPAPGGELLPRIC